MEKSLIIKSELQTLSKEQLSFNRLVKKIEKLQKEIQKNTLLLDEKMKFYNNEICHLETKLSDIEVSLTKCFYSYFKKNIFKGKDKSGLKNIISFYLNSLFHVVENDKEMKEMFKHIEGVAYDDVLDQQFEMQKSMMESMFDFYGVDVNTDNFKRDMTPEEIFNEASKILEGLEDAEEKENNKQKARKKTKRQLQQEQLELQKEEMRNKNISQVYKQLAKMFHPDLERDLDKKTEKEELMKQLSIAYNNKDLHTLLRLEMEYIQKEENDTKNLSAEKLKIYNEVLKEQANELQAELYDLPIHPQYSVLQKFVKRSVREVFNLKLEPTKKELTQKITELQKGLERLQGHEEAAIKEIKEAIKQYWHTTKKAQYEY